jgi:hypothetical protein
MNRLFRNWIRFPNRFLCLAFFLFLLYRRLFFGDRLRFYRLNFILNLDNLILIRNGLGSFRRFFFQFRFRGNFRL